MFLAIDTSTGTSVALVDSAGVIRSSRLLPDTMRHVEVVGTFIQEVLEECGVAPAQLNAVVAGMGPGPFTGLRIGIAAARAFGLGAGIPVVPLISHDAVALEWYRNGGSGDVQVRTDARRREFYWSSYSGIDAEGIPVRTAGPGLGRPDDLPTPTGELLTATGVSAGYLGILAVALSDAGREGAADEALYIRPPDIYPTGPKKRVTQ